MTDSHWVSLTVGVVLIAGVLLYNFLEARRVRVPGMRSEPPRPEVVAAEETKPAEDIEADLPDSDLQAAGPLSAAPLEQAAPCMTSETALASGEALVLNTDVECVVRMQLPKTPAAAFSDLVGVLNTLGSPFRILGLREDRVWEPVGKTGDASYARVDAGLQLASRRGPVTAGQVEAWCRHLRHFASLHGGSVECPPVDQIVQRAEDLDRFCISVDVLISLHVVAPVGYPFRAVAIHRLLEEAGLRFDPSGIYQLSDENGNTQFTVSNREGVPFVGEGRGPSTHGLVFSLEVAHVQGGVPVFDVMASLAQELASNLSGTVVDDQGQPYNPQSDRRQLIDYCRRLRARNIEPGTDLARRLFS